MGNSHNFCRVSTRFVTLSAIWILRDGERDRSRLAGRKEADKGESQGTLLSRCRLVTHRRSERARGHDRRIHGSITLDYSDRDRRSYRFYIVPTPVPRSMNNSISRGGDRRRTVLSPPPFFFLLTYVFNHRCEYGRILKRILEWFLEKDSSS